MSVWKWIMIVFVILITSIVSAQVAIKETKARLPIYQRYLEAEKRAEYMCEKAEEQYRRKSEAWLRFTKAVENGFLERGTKSATE